MKKNYISLVLILITVLSYSQNSIEISGSISSDVEWNTDTIKIIGETKVENNATLTIKSGTYIEFQGHYMLKVHGCLIAKGAINDTIVFTANDTIDFANNDTIGWHGIRFMDINNENDSSLISYCKFMYGKASGDGFNQSGGAIFVKDFSRLLISNSYFINNYSTWSAGAIGCYNASPNIQNNVFKNNHASFGGAISCTENSNAKISRNFIYNNFSNSTGGGIDISKSNPEILNNVLSNNSSTWGGGVSMWNYSNPVLFGNLISKNHASNYGGGINCDLYSEPMIINNTIIENDAVVDGADIIINRFAKPNVINSIFWGNENPIAFIDEDSYMKLSYSFIQSNEGVLPSYVQIGDSNVFNKNPQFENFEVENYRLQHISECINSGSNEIEGFEFPEIDIEGNKRISSTSIDIGAYEFQFLDIITCNSYTSPSENYTWTISGIYYDTIPNSVDTDSIIAIDLTILQSTTFNYSETACDSYISPSGKIWTTSNTYMDTIQNKVGCDSIITINLTIDCANSITSNTILPILVYPNPTKGFINIELDKYYENLTMFIYNILGQLVAKENYKEINQLTYNIADSNGHYVIKLFSEKREIFVTHLIKQ